MTHVCIYTRCPNTEFRWILSKAVFIICDDNDLAICREVKRILVNEGFLHINERLCGDERVFKMVDDTKISSEINENDEDEHFTTYRSWLFSNYPEWFACKDCRHCNGRGTFREYHGTNSYWHETILCDCCSIDNDNSEFMRNYL